MKESPPYQIVELAELKALRAVTEGPEEPQSASVATSPTEATVATPVSENSPEEPENGNGDGMPDSLRGLSLLELSLLDVDNLMTPQEQAFYNKRRWKIEEYRRFHRTPGPNDWMGF